MGQNTFETVEDAGARAAVQERAWDLVWQRKIVYFGVLASLVWLLCYPLFVSFPEVGEFTSPLRPVSDLVRIVGSFVPAGFSLWVDTYARNPALFSLSLFTLIALCMFETRLSNRIGDEIRAAWWPDRSTSPREPIANSWTHELRTSAFYQRTLQFLRRHIVPTAFAATYFFLIVYVILVLVNRLAFVSMDAVGVFCEHNPKQVRLEKKGFATHSFDISSFCLGTGIIVRSGERYFIQATQSSPLQDGATPAFVGGIDTTKLTFLQRRQTALARPFARSWVRPWFTVIARVGSVGSEEFYLGPDPTLLPGQVDTVFRARSEGELFVYVNDVALGLPWLKDLYYLDNSGKLAVQIGAADF